MESNAMLLYMICEKKGYRMPAFMTFKSSFRNERDDKEGGKIFSCHFL
jgi:hypothetical protein